MAMTARGSVYDEPATSLDQAFWKYKDLVWRFFACAGVPESSREDLCQDTFFQVVSWWPKGVKNWSHVLFHCAKQVLQNYRRKNRRQMTSEHVECDNSYPDVDQPSIERIVGSREMLEICARALKRMSEDDSMLVYLKVIEGLRLDEVVAIMNSTTTIVKSRLQRARDEFRGLLIEEGAFIRKTRQKGDA
jgi:RNA polymerase sigma-70 factor, ECF subfamily